MLRATIFSHALKRCHNCCYLVQETRLYTGYRLSRLFLHFHSAVFHICCVRSIEDSKDLYVLGVCFSEYEVLLAVS